MDIVAASSSIGHALFAAILVGGGLSLIVVGILARSRRHQQSLAMLLDETMGEAPIPVEVVSESPDRNETTSVTSRLADSFGRYDSRGELERRLERADIPMRIGEYLVLIAAACILGGVAFTVMFGTPVVGFIVMALVALVAWKYPGLEGKKAGEGIAGSVARRPLTHGCVC